MVRKKAGERGWVGKRGSCILGVAMIRTGKDSEGDAAPKVDQFSLILASFRSPDYLDKLRSALQGGQTEAYWTVDVTSGGRTRVGSVGLSRAGTMIRAERPQMV